MMESPAIELQGLTKRYGAFEAVSGLQLNIRPGEIFALLGPNGAGKTTTLRMLMGILRASAGTARIHGLDCFVDRVEVKRFVGFLPDDPIFYDYLLGREILGFVAGMHGVSKQESTARGHALVARLGLEEDIESFAMNYSKGTKKKLGLACALIHAPKVLILDEPTNGLDPHTTHVCLDMIRELAASGVTVLYSTHLLDQAERVCHRIGIMNRGSFRAVGTLEQLRANRSGGDSLESIFFALLKEDPR